MSYYAGKVVWITGSSSGIGAALARELARQGAQVVITARRQELLDDLARDIIDQGGHALALACDVTHRADLDRVVAATCDKLGKLDIVVANAGFGVEGDVESLEIADFRRQFETNVFGVLETVRAALPEIKRNRGSIALVGSVMGHLSMAGAAPYCMSKYAVTALAESLWYELASTGVSVTLISPGFIASDIRRVNNNGVLRSGAKDPIPAWLTMPAPQAARRIARAIARRRFEEVITAHGKLAVWAYRHFPDAVRVIIRLATRAVAPPTEPRP